MDSVYCTLYNSFYLDKGLVLYDSLCECAGDFILYVLCMDDKSYDVITSLNQVNHIPIKLDDFEKNDEQLKIAKANRPFGEYCWTCTPSFILYVLNHFHHDICTYIDADMYFYSNPQLLIDEMIYANKSVMVVPHRFPSEKEGITEKVGKYCVEFNTFKNNSEGLEVLVYWRNRCIECCSNLGDGIHWGDQKYLDEFEKLFRCVHVCQNDGAGVAPWNIVLYKRKDLTNNALLYGKDNKTVSIMFFHYASIAYLTNRLVNTSIIRTNNLDLKLVNKLYKDYLIQLSLKKQMLKNRFNVDILMKRHPASIKKRTMKQRVSSSVLLAILRSRFGVLGNGHGYCISF